jgi:hypothetical protein
MDGTITDGRKGIPYLRDHFLPAVVRQALVDAETAEQAVDHERRAAEAPAPV